MILLVKYVKFFKGCEFNFKVNIKGGMYIILNINYIQGIFFINIISFLFMIIILSLDFNYNRC